MIEFEHITANQSFIEAKQQKTEQEDETSAEYSPWRCTRRLRNIDEVCVQKQ